MLHWLNLIDFYSFPWISEQGNDRVDEEDQKENEFKNSSDREKEGKWDRNTVKDILIIGGSALGISLICFVTAFCVYRKCKSAELKDTDVDLNPVYGDYSEVYQETEITDTNADYGAPDLEGVGCSLVTDLNSVYGSWYLILYR